MESVKKIRIEYLSSLDVIKDDNVLKFYIFLVNNLSYKQMENLLISIKNNLTECGIVNGDNNVYFMLQFFDDKTDTTNEDSCCYNFVVIKNDKDASINSIHKIIRNNWASIKNNYYNMKVNNTLIYNVDDNIYYKFDYSCSKSKVMLPDLKTETIKDE